MKLGMLGLWTACALCATAPASAPRLLWPSDRSGNFDIYLMNADGSEVVNLTDSKYRNTDPAWSPDGKKIAFGSDRSGGSDIFVMDADGKNVKQLTTDAGANVSPAWSPDGKKIAFASTRENRRYELYVMNADGSDQKPLTSDGSYNSQPAWSPDGKKIVYMSHLGRRGFGLRIIDVEEKSVEEPIKAEGLSAYVYPAWSLDGKKIVYAERADENIEIWSASVDGSDKKQLTKLAGTNSYAAWSPDGKQIAFQHLELGEQNSSLYVMDADGGNVKEILKNEGPGRFGRPAWKPK